MPSASSFSLPARRSRGSLILALLLVGAIVALVHKPVLEAQAQSLDDPMFVTYNPLVLNPGWNSVRRFFVEVLHPSSVAGYYLPLSMTSLMVDVALGARPDDLTVFHRTNLALHVAATLLLLLILYRLFGALVPAAIAALLFGIHPLTVEPTAWVGERKTLLATGFAFASLWTWLVSMRPKANAWRVASIVFYLLALLSKPTVLMLPVLMLVLVVWPLRRPMRGALADLWPYVALSAVFAGITLLSHEATAGLMPYSASDALPTPFRVGYLIAFYLGKIVWPVDLSCIYPPPPSPWTLPAVLASVALVIALTLAVVLLARRTPGPLAGWAYFLVALAPTLGVIRYSWVAASDKYLYFPALGLLMLVTWGLTAAWNSPRLGAGARVVAAVPLLLVAGAEARGVRQTLGHWSDSMSLFRQMERVAPESPVVHAQLGVLLERQSKQEEALVHLRRALALAPEFPVAYFNLGVVLARQGKLEESIAMFRASEALSPGSPLTLYNIGLSMRMLGRLDSAATELRRAIAAKPDYLDALDELAGVLMNSGHPDEAAATLRRAVAITPGDPRLRYRLAAALLLGGGDPAEAIGHLREAIRVQPDWPEPYNTLAWLRATHPDAAVRDTGEALALGARAAQLTASRDPRVLDTLAAAQAAAGRFAQAIRTEHDAITLLAAVPADTLARGMRERMKLYERGQPYREPAKPSTS
jgi:protein O-mannosyl-transferase